MILFERAEIATMIASLRFYQREISKAVIPDHHPEYWFEEIATDGGTLISLDSDGIEELIETKLQMLQRE